MRDAPDQGSQTQMPPGAGCVRPNWEGENIVTGRHEPIWEQPSLSSGKYVPCVECKLSVAKSYRLSWEARNLGLYEISSLLNLHTQGRYMKSPLKIGQQAFSSVLFASM